MKADRIKVITVFGAGIMGSGIAQVCAQQGYKVYLTDVNQEFLDSGINRIQASLGKFSEKGVLSLDRVKEIISLIITTADPVKAAQTANLVIEAIPEKMELKKQLFNRIDGICSEDTFLTTNTSTLSITEMASGIRRPDRFIGTHFFNPVPLMNLVEIIKGLLTSSETVEVITDFTRKLGKEPILVNDKPGFITSRLGLAMFMEASRMLEEGVGTVEDIDKGMRLGYGHRMGPFETCDIVGLDARLNNINAMYESTRDPLWKPPQLLRQLVAAGFLGRKSGSKGGYYVYFGLNK